MVRGHLGQSVCVVLVHGRISMTRNLSQYCLADLGCKCCIYTERDAKSCSSAQCKKLENILEQEPYLVLGKPVLCPQNERISVEP